MTLASLFNACVTSLRSCLMACRLSATSVASQITRASKMTLNALSSASHRVVSFERVASPADPQLSRSHSLSRYVQVSWCTANRCDPLALAPEKVACHQVGDDFVACAERFTALVDCCGACRRPGEHLYMALLYVGRGTAESIASAEARHGLRRLYPSTRARWQCLAGAAEVVPDRGLDKGRHVLAAFQRRFETHAGRLRLEVRFVPNQSV